MEFIELKANTRTTKGNSPARALRRDGKIPAVIYGPNTAPAMLSISVNDLENALKKKKGGQLFLNLTIEGEDGNHTVMLKELQRHPVSRRFIHADLYEVAMDRKLRVRVPVVTTGKCRGVEMGGMLQIIRRDLEVLCFPNDIPDVIELDISDMDMGDSIHIEDIAMENIEFSAEVNFTVLTVLSPKGKEEEEAEGEEGEEEAAEEEAEEEA